MIRRLAVLASGLILASLWAAPASASCAMMNPDPRVRVHEALTKHPTVFTGTVVRTSNAARDAVVSVDKIWKGGKIPAEVVMHGGTFGGSAFSSVDRRYETGARYVFVSNSTQSPFEHNACSATTELTENIAWLTPDNAQSPQPVGTSLPFGPAAVGLGAAGALAALVRLAIRRPTRLAA